MLIRKSQKTMMVFIVIIIALSFKQMVCSSIIDTKSPIVIHDSSGGNNSFGYSLSFMRGYLGEGGPPSSVSFGRTGQTKATLFIGAPDEKYASTRNTGVVWQCKFDASAVQLSCSILSAVSGHSSHQPSSCRQKFGNLIFPEKESEQWIGASLSSSGSKLFACAPRWKRNGWTSNFSQSSCTETAMVGACYMASSQTDIPHLLSSLQKPDSFYYGSMDSNGRDVNEYWYLYAELGFSSHITPESENLLLGAPSVRKWRGAVLEYQKGYRYEPFIHNEVGNIPKVETHSLLGYTVTSGRLPGRSYYIASGAPRAKNLYGVVTISYPRTRTPVGYYYGEQFGSYFGYALATADLNNDGYDELIVGAPWHTPDFKNPDSYSTGCVVIYDITRLPNVEPIQPVLCMDSQKVSMGARFGSAICNLGDINFDKIDDFAVSAPYDDDGFGTVFIFHGSYPPSDKPAQIIKGQGLNIPNLYGFGTYLLGGSNLDVDGNGTPDLAISSFESRHVVLLRSRPVANATITVSYHTAESSGFRDRIFKLVPNQLNFRVRTCIALHFSVELSSENENILDLDAWIKFDADPKEKRVDFDDPSHQSKQHVRVSPLKETCLETQLKVTQEDILVQGDGSDIIFRATLWYNETELLYSQTPQHASLMVSPTAHEYKSNPEYQQVYRSFEQYLPAPIPVTESNWEPLRIARDNCDSDGNPECDPQLRISTLTVQLSNDKSGEVKKSGDQSGIAGQLESITILLTVSNLKETADEPAVRIKMAITDNFEMNSARLLFTWLESPGKQGQCQSTAYIEKQYYVSRMRCPQPLHAGKDMKFVLRIGNLQHIKLTGQNKKGEIKFDVEAFPVSREQDRLVKKEAKVGLEGDVKIKVESRVTSASDIDPKTTNLVDLTQLYVVENLGFSGTAMEQVKAEILVPTHVNFQKGGNWTQVIGVDNPSTLDVQCEAVNFKFFSAQELGSDKNAKSTTGSGTGSSRSTRSTASGSGFPPLKVVSPEKVSVSESKEKFITLSDCRGVGNVPPGSCQKIICNMSLPSKGSREIKIQMYLLKEAIGKLVTVETKGIRVESIIYVTYFGKTIDKVGTTQRGFILVKSVPAWVYLAAGAGGTILFLLITFALFKCGFFRRKTKEQLKQLKRQTLAQLDAGALRELDASIRAQQEANELRDDDD